jgi:flavin reductase (DIM6/NTAB) family NADH-FMN oxidoreductase RutF
VTAVSVPRGHFDLDPVTPDLFRSVFRDHAARVVVVTAAGRPRPVGLTATSLASVSVDPPMVSFAVGRSASAWRTLSRSTNLAVHLLAEDQDWLAGRFATSGIDRFAKLDWSRGPRGEPIIDDCAAYLTCRVVRHVPAGDHVLVLARVNRAGVQRPGAPLIYHDGGYAGVHAAGDRRTDDRPTRSVFT